MSFINRLLKLTSLSLCFAFAGAKATYSRPSVTSTPTAIVSNLNLDSRGSTTTHIVKVADITLSTDNATGLSLFVSTGNLTKSGGSSIAYQVTTVEEGAPPPISSDFGTGNYTFSTSTQGIVNKQVYIQYTPAPLQESGTYSSSIPLIVTDN